MRNKKILMRGLGISLLSTLVILCIYLAFWQIDRGKEKDIIFQSYMKNISSDPIEISDSDFTPVDFTKVILRGRFSASNQFLLDNKVHNKKAGYDVITPLEVDDKTVLINRGWVDNNSRTKLPNIELASEYSEVIGYVYYYKKPYTLSDDNSDSGWPRLLQTLDTNVIASILDRKVEPYLIVMSENQENSLQIRNIFKKNDKLKHYMYAGQWFIFATIGTILIIVLLKRSKQ